MKTLVGDYYLKMDDMEEKRFGDQAKNQTAEMVGLPEHSIEEAKERVLQWAQANGVNTEDLLDKENKQAAEITSDEWADVIQQYMQHKLKANLAERKSKRINGVLVPDALMSLNMTDKDGN